MDLALVFSLIALALATGSAVVSIVALRLQQSPPDLSALKSKVSTLDLDLTELADRQNTWMRRDAARTARESRPTPMHPAVAVAPQDKKAALRARLNAGTLNVPLR